MQAHCVTLTTVLPLGGAQILVRDDRSWQQWSFPQCARLRRCRGRLARRHCRHSSSVQRQSDRRGRKVRCRHMDARCRDPVCRVPTHTPTHTFQPTLTLTLTLTPTRVCTRACTHTPRLRLIPAAQWCCWSWSWWFIRGKGRGDDD